MPSMDTTGSFMAVVREKAALAFTGLASNAATAAATPTTVACANDAAVGLHGRAHTTAVSMA